MSESSHWRLRVENNCLFIDDTSTNRMVLQQNARPGVRPYIHPLYIGNKVCLTEDSPWHHPWQHGIQTGFHGVDDCDFWFDPGQRSNFVIGTIEPSTPVILDREPPRWMIEAMWRHADGHYLLAERQIWWLRKAESLRFLDLDWTLQAIADVKIDQNEYGGLFIRMPFRQSTGGDVLNNGGLRNNDTEQQPAQWVDLHMPIENSETGGGIVVFDHPDNAGHPVKWRVDNQLGINPTPCIESAINLLSGTSINYRYRMVLHGERLSDSQINELWVAYAEA